VSWTRCRLGHRHWGPHGAAGLLLAYDGSALLQLRATWAHRGGTWSVPGGAIERGESALHAALRETEEELGVDGAAVRTAGSRVADCGGGWTYETVLGVPADPGAPLAVRDLAESAGHAWVPAAEVADLSLHPAFRAAWTDADGVLRDFVTAS
jgi:8-oxo-dGTP diphosphatase